MEYFVNENVLYINSLNGYVKWHTAKILKKKSTHVYSILVNNLVKLAHINQLRKTIMKKKENFNNGNEKLNSSTNQTLQNELNPRRSSRLRMKPDWFQAGV